MTPPAVDPKVANARIVAFAQYQAKNGVKVQVPVTQEGKLILFECLPDCGKCCHPRALSLLPRDVKALAARAPANLDFVKDCTHEGDFGLSQLNVKPFEACPFLKDDQRCAVYGARPHPCRLYPFHYDADGNVGYLEDAQQVCPGLHLGDNLSEMEPLLEELAEEVAAGLPVVKEAALKAVVAQEDASRVTISYPSPDASGSELSQP